ncbi:hypothetical protein M3J09_012622 [Ascochyta lentis]
MLALRYFGSLLQCSVLQLDVMGLANVAQRYLTAFAVLTTAGSASTVSLPGYGSFAGTTVSQYLTKRPLPATVDAWLGIDYASQPVGEHRFAPVGPPAPFSGTKNATQYGYSCIQDASMVPYPQDEACLSLNVFRPQNVSSTAKLPVFIWIHGGGFVSGSARSFDGPAFVANSEEPLIVVNFNYRINSLGFLPSPVFDRLGLLTLDCWTSNWLLSLSNNTSQLLVVTLTALPSAAAPLVLTLLVSTCSITTTRLRAHLHCSPKLSCSLAVSLHVRSPTHRIRYIRSNSPSISSLQDAAALPTVQTMRLLGVCALQTLL